MYWVLLFITFVLISATFIGLGLYVSRTFPKKRNREVVSPLTLDLGCFCCFITTCILVASVCTILNASSNTYKLIEQIRASNNKTIILKERAQRYTKEFSTLLAEVYPQHEKAVFENLTQSQLLVYAVKYPQLKSIEGFKVLVKQIAVTNDELYKELLKREDMIQVARYNKVSPWYIPALIPDIPENIIK